MKHFSFLLIITWLTGVLFHFLHEEQPWSDLLLPPQYKISQYLSALKLNESVSFNLFIYLGFYVAFNTVQVISRRVVGRAEETSTYSSLGLCTVNCRPTASNYQLSHMRPCRESNPGLRGGRRECYHSATVAPLLASSPTTQIYED